MKHLLAITAVITLAGIGATTTACKDPQTANDWINEGFTVAQFACTQESNVNEPAALAIACGIINAGQKIAPEVEAFVESLILGRNAKLGKGQHFDRARVVWVTL